MAWDERKRKLGRKGKHGGEEYAWENMIRITLIRIQLINRVS